MTSTDSRAGPGASATRRRVCLLPLTAAALLALPGPAESQGAFERIAADFVTQNVCIGQDNRATGASPLDCREQRDLLPGERLPYHKHDWPNSRQIRVRPAGDERQDSVPALLGRTFLVLHSFDSGIEGRAFGVFDPTDGGQVVSVSGRTAGVVLNRDGKGAKLFVGPRCAPGGGITALQDSWVLFDERVRGGSLVARLKLVRTAAGCPGRLDAAFTAWHMRQVPYRRSLDGAETAALTTLVSDHFSQETPAASGSMERHYLTRELGFTRWERWQNLSRLDRPEYRERAEAYARSGRCPPRVPGPDSGEWVMVACREWTNIVPASSPNGDDPRPWIAQFFADPLISAAVDPR